jgi:hypothetical protein
VAPRVDYDHHGRTYAQHRRADPRIAARIHVALGDARTVVNVGAAVDACARTFRSTTMRSMPRWRA